jgi:hypothetical protein
LQELDNIPLGDLNTELEARGLPPVTQVTSDLARKEATFVLAGEPTDRDLFINTLRDLITQLTGIPASRISGIQIVAPQGVKRVLQEVSQSNDWTAVVTISDPPPPDSSNARGLVASIFFLAATLLFVH